MLLEELQSGDIMYMSLLKYANENGGITSWYYFLSQNIADPSIPEIITWTHSSTQPTIADLLTYNVSDMDVIRETLRSVQQVVDVNQSQIIPMIATSSLSYATPDARDGTCVFDTTALQLKVFYGGVWY